MKNRKLAVIGVMLMLSVFATLSTPSFGNDTTLFKQRVDKIKLLGKWLQARPYHKSAMFSPADTDVLRKTYDTAVDLFFDKQYLNNKFNLIASIRSFDLIQQFLSVDTSILKMPDPFNDTLRETTEDYTAYFENTIILYFPMFNDEFEGFYFEFAANSDQLIFMIEAGGINQEYKKKKKFLNSLHPKK